MLAKLKADFDAILELVNKAPVPLQETAFRIILEKWFATSALPPPPLSPPPGTPAPPDSSGAQLNVPDSVKPFLTANGITSELLAKVFHPVGPGAQLLASEIPGTGKAAKLIALSLLLCVKQALESGSFTCPLMYLREMAVHYDCYDSPNFSANLKAKKSFYKPRQKGADLELSGPGLKRAADTIKTIAAGE